MKKILNIVLYRHILSNSVNEENFHNFFINKHMKIFDLCNFTSGCSEESASSLFMKSIDYCMVIKLILPNFCFLK